MLTAISKGNKSAYLALGEESYKDGAFEKAILYLEKAYEFGFFEACDILCSIYQKSDPQTSKTWARAGAIGGNNRCIQAYIAHLKKNMWDGDATIGIIFYWTFQLAKDSPYFDSNNRLGGLLSKGWARELDVIALQYFTLKVLKKIRYPLALDTIRSNSRFFK